MWVTWDRTQAISKVCSRPQRETKPGQTRPNQTRSDQAKPDQVRLESSSVLPLDYIRQGETSPGHFRSGQTGQDQAMPGQIKPDQTTPNRPAQPKSGQVWHDQFRSELGKAGRSDSQWQSVVAIAALRCQGGCEGCVLVARAHEQWTASALGRLTSQGFFYMPPSPPTRLPPHPHLIPLRCMPA